MENFWKEMLGTEAYKPFFNVYRQKLRSATAQTKEATRSTPRFLRTILTPDDKQDSRLQGESGDTMAVLKWDVVKEYAGSMADVLTQRQTSAILP
jgi:hypothetical protein